MAFDRKTYQREYMRKRRAADPAAAAAEREKTRNKQREKRAADPEAAKASRREYYLTHKERSRETCAAYQKANPEKVNGYQIKYRTTRRDHRRSLERTRYAANPAKFVHKAKLRRARIYNAPGRSTVEQVLARVQYHGWRCRYCGKELDEETLTIDHVIPLIRGGSEWPSNKVPACKPCNSAKRDYTLNEFNARTNRSGHPINQADLPRVA